jgi:uncharacterized protein
VQSQALLDFQLKILTLKPGRYTYTLPVNDAFFASFEHSIVQKGNLQATVTLDKSETLIRAAIAIDGTIELESDRSLELFDHPLSLQHELLYRYGDESKEITEELYQLAWESPTLDLAQPIFEYITLAVPMRKLKPTEEPEPKGTLSDAERHLVYSSAPPEAEETPLLAPTDPKWEALRKLFPN